MPTDKISKPSPITETTQNQIEPRVAILMCTFNGEKYLRQQLDSFCAQSHENWTLLVSDDGSTDDTVRILSDYTEQLQEHQLRIIKGPQTGYVENFLHITRSAEPAAEFYAWADQDDIWHSEKLAAALNTLKKEDSGTAAFYCSRTHLINESGATTGYSKTYHRPPQFLNALVQNISGGNTMVFNRTAFNLLRQTRKEMDVISHDWWAYQLISGAGGKVHYDSIARVFYRQHSENVIGNKKTFFSKVRHLRKIFRGLHSEWNDKNIHALDQMREILNEENRTVLDAFKHARNEKIFKRTYHLLKLGIHRQTPLGNVALLLAIIFKKI